MTFKRLNGWLRLWIVLAFFWGTLVASFGVLEWPSSRSLNRFVILEKLDQKSVEIIAGGKSKYSSGTPVPPEDLPINLREKATDTNPFSAFTPKGRVFKFAGEELVVSVTDAEMEALLRNYDQVLHKLLMEKRLALVAWLFMLWVVPLAIIGVAAFSIRWVYDGFKSPR
jgi:hypothetical protein